jgi:hypothetical protein
MDEKNRKNSEQISIITKIKYNQFLSDLSNGNFLEKKNKSFI